MPPAAAAVKSSCCTGAATLKRRVLKGDVYEPSARRLVLYGSALQQSVNPLSYTLDPIKYNCKLAG
jgi:hypothetical protein